MELSNSNKLFKSTSIATCVGPCVTAKTIVVSGVLAKMFTSESMVEHNIQLTVSTGVLELVGLEHILDIQDANPIPGFRPSILRHTTFAFAGVLITDIDVAERLLSFDFPTIGDIAEVSSIETDIIAMTADEVLKTSIISCPKSEGIYLVASGPHAKTIVGAICNIKANEIQHQMNPATAERLFKAKLGSLDATLYEQADPAIAQSEISDGRRSAA